MITCHPKSTPNLNNIKGLRQLTVNFGRVVLLYLLILFTSLIRNAPRVLYRSAMRSHRIFRTMSWISTPSGSPPSADCHSKNVYYPLCIAQLLKTSSTIRPHRRARGAQLKCRFIKYTSPCLNSQTSYLGLIKPRPN